MVPLTSSARVIPLLLLIIVITKPSITSAFQLQKHQVIAPRFSPLFAFTNPKQNSNPFFIIHPDEARSAWHHLWETFPRLHLPEKPSTAYTHDHNHYYESVQDLANVQIPRTDGSGGTLYAYQTTATTKNTDKTKVVFLLHEFFGLSQSICDKADALANDLDCTVIAPDTFRGETSTFIPKCIWLALTTPQDRVNADLTTVLEWYKNTTNETTLSLAVMGFCYGGGKAIRYTTECQPTAATVLCYGSPVTDVEALRRLQKPVCGIFGANDLQFPPPVLEAFESALKEAAVVDYSLTVYPNVGHAFWSDMDQVAAKQEPQYSAYQTVVEFLKEHL